MKKETEGIYEQHACINAILSSEYCIFPRTKCLMNQAVRYFNILPSIEKSVTGYESFGTVVCMLCLRLLHI